MGRVFPSKLALDTQIHDHSRSPRRVAPQIQKYHFFVKIEFLAVDQFWPYFFTMPPHRTIFPKCGWELRLKNVSMAHLFDLKKRLHVPSTKTHNQKASVSNSKEDFDRQKKESFQL